MKAIACPQCGGLINKVSKGDSIVECGYCGAKVWLQEEEKPEPAPPPREEHAPLENYKPFDEIVMEGMTNNYDALGEPFSPNADINKAVAIGMAVVALIFFFVIFGVFSKTKKPPPETYQPTVVPRWSPSYPVTVQAGPPDLGNDDALVLPKPVLPKGFRVREETSIMVYISVDEKGKVYQAESYDVDVPEALKKAAVQAAKKAKFAEGPLTSGTLVYNFGPR
jgi:DNA-directed RNA polymerase subunit RPC12/RpoP